MMKKLLLLMTCILSINFAYSQDILNEDFSGGVMPPEGWSIDAHSVNWDISSSNKAGCDAPEAMMKYAPAFNGTSRLISPVIDASGYENLSIKLNYFVDHYNNSYKIGIAVRNGEGAWNKIWEQNINNDVPATQKIISVDNAGEDNTAFQYCFFFEGNSYNFDNIYLDNFTLFNAANLDLAVNKIEMPLFEFSGTHDVKTTLVNLGVEAVNNFEINWQVDNGVVHTEQVTQSIPSFGSYLHTFADTWEVTSGLYEIKIWISAVNGGNDDLEENNEKTKTVSIASQSVQRMPLFEEFTSSTCGPCASFNSQFEPWCQQHDDIAIIKYQMNWPGSGDIYYTEEGGTRRYYYGVSGVPAFSGDGNLYSASMGNVNSFYNSSIAHGAMMEIEGSHEINNKVVSGSVTINPFVSVEGVTLHVVVVEKETTGNVGSNGETVFKQVMMKMIPNAEGTTINIEDGTPFVFDYEQDLSNTHVEEYDDLEVVLFVQYNPTKEIMQSAISTEGDVPPPPAPTATTNVNEGDMDVPLNTEFTITFDQPIRALDNSELTNENIDDHIIFTGTYPVKEDIVFDATINSAKTVITIVPETDLYGLFCTLAMEATVENQFDTPIVPFSIEFGMVGIATSDVLVAPLQVYPNPVKGHTNVTFELKERTDVTLELYSVNGQLSYQQKMNQVVGKQSVVVNTSDFEKGVYTCKLQAGNQIKYVKLVVM